ncbi:MAG: hypothetical protein E6K14_04260 [Methanobacteriota archaeon]|nr:MAG: hypothetical protein E6K14_04260 [Euryarchaeota archaeon]
MRPPRRIDAFVRDVERAIDVAVDGQPRPVLAFSGGLASLLLAMVGRKRSDLRCLVAGVEGSADIAAAKRAKDSFEYRVEVVALDAARVRTIATGLTTDFPGLTGAQRSELVPLRAVLLRAPDTSVLAGLRRVRHSVEVGRAAERAGVRLPLFHVQGGGVSRETVRSAALYLGLPAAWARVRHRSPSEGAGIVHFLRPRDASSSSEDDLLGDNQ